MGFLDKAKKLAEEAQTKLDEVQKQMNEKQGTTGAPVASAPTPSPTPHVEYDQHGRKVPVDGERPQGDPLAADPPHSGNAAAETHAQPSDPEPPHGDPLTQGEPKPATPPTSEPPKPPTPPSGGGFTSGDPLSG